MDMLEIRQLEVFRTVMERGSATLAAQVLGISQPAVSTLLNKLEEAIGYPLFVREHRRLTPTAEAIALVDEVAAVLDRHAQLSRTAHDIHETRAGSLTIASHPGPSISWLPPVIARFVAARPGVTVKLISRQSQGVRDLIPSRAFDLAVAELPVEHPLAAVNRYQMSFVAVLHSGHPLAKHALLTPRLLDGSPFIGMFRGHAAQLGASKAFDEAGAHLRVVAECDYFASAISLAARGVGVALVDPISAQDMKSEALAVRPFAPSLAYHFAVFHPHDRPMSKLANAFAAEFDAYLLAHGAL
ncbi:MULTISPECIES: LysR substrate-binding domain-containing protein [Cupriavidus]